MNEEIEPSQQEQPSFWTRKVLVPTWLLILLASFGVVSLVVDPPSMTELIFVAIWVLVLLPALEVYHVRRHRKGQPIRDPYAKADTFGDLARIMWVRMRTVPLWAAIAYCTAVIVIGLGALATL